MFNFAKITQVDIRLFRQLFLCKAFLNPAAKNIVSYDFSELHIKTPLKSLAEIVSFINGNIVLVERTQRLLLLGAPFICFS